MKIASSVRPVHLYQSGKWRTMRTSIALDECSVEMGHFFYDCRDLSSLVGCTCFGYKAGLCIYVFDFSASHLCPNQLAKVKQYYADVR